MHRERRHSLSNNTSVRLTLPLSVQKQADTVLLQYPLDVNQSQALSARNLEYYGPRVDVAGGPAMTWSVHTIGFLRIDQPERAHSFFNRSCKTGDAFGFVVLSVSLT